MKILSSFLYLILATLSFSSVADNFEYQVIQGKWGAYTKNWISDDWYQYLSIQDEGGVFVYSYGGEPKVFRFGVSDIQELQGMALIAPECCDELRLVVSAFRTTLGSALLTGLMFLFKDEEGREVLFNTIPLRMESIDKDPELKKRLKDVISRTTVNL